MALAEKKARSFSSAGIMNDFFHSHFQILIINTSWQREMMKSNRAIRIHVCMVGNAWPTVVSDAASAMDTIPDGQYN